MASTHPSPLWFSISDTCLQALNGSCVLALSFFLSLTNFFFPSLALIWHYSAWVFNQGIPHPHSQIQQALTSGKGPGLDARPPAETGPTASPYIYFPRTVAKVLSDRHYFSHIKVSLGLSLAKQKPMSPYIASFKHRTENMVGSQ